MKYNMQKERGDISYMNDLCVQSIQPLTLPAVSSRRSWSWMLDPSSRRGLFCLATTKIDTEYH